MIERTHPKLSVGAQCQLLSIARSSFYYAPQGETALNLDLMLLIDKQFLETPFYGVRQMSWHLQNEGHAVNEKRIRRLMRCAFHVIRPSVPRASGRAFHEHPATLVRGLRGFSSLLIASPAVKGVGGAEGCPREGPARPAPRRPGGWRCRARGRGRWASRGEGHAHCPASARLSAPVLRSDGPSRAMR